MCFLGCGARTVPVARVTPSWPVSSAVAPSVTVEPASSSRVTPPQSNVVDLPLSKVTFTCRLPVSIPASDSGSGGFIEFPSATVTPDPTFISSGRPVGEASYYDRAFSQWLPVSRTSVSRDGTHYVYAVGSVSQTTGTIHVVDVQTGRDEAFAEPYWFVPLDYAPEGIYLMTDYEVADGLWLLDPSTGVTKRVADLPYVQASAGNKAFWVGSTNPADPNPIPGIGATPDEVERFSLVDGSRQVWFYRPGTQVYVIGQDLAGHPLVISAGESGQRTEYLVVPGPGEQRSILKGAEGTLPDLATPIADSHGIWFGGQNGIYLYTEGAGLKKVSPQPGYPANGCF